MTSHWNNGRPRSAGIQTLRWILLLAFIASAGRSDAVPPAAPMAMWVWDVRLIASPRSQERLLKFCRKQNIACLFVSAYQISENENENFRALNKNAHAQGIEIHALAGDPRWALSRYHHLTLQWMDSVIVFNASSRPEERFDGIHTDIEPYLLTRGWTEHPARLLGGFLDLHFKIAQRLGPGRALKLGVDVPFWYDDDEYRIEWHGAVKAPSHHILDLADILTVMAYRNYADGADGTIAISRNEIDTAEQAGKSVFVGQETQPDLFPAYITFGGTSKDYFLGEIAKVVRAFQSKKSFGGIAVHHYETYEKLAG
ncbi:MAG: hypothetical protein HY594_01190 [Candidatus Omnitrophica bacterium]|nr:hypothetical protein [Candidatus Omnitrophota bacterium]